MSNLIVPTTQSQTAIVTGTPLSSNAQRLLKREMECSTVRALVAEARERERAALASEALHEAGSLAALEGLLVQIAPLGESRYRAINDAYIVGVTTAIIRY